MELTEISLLHIGDIHWPDFKNCPFDIDCKDGKFPSGITNAISGRPTTVVIRNLVKILNKQNAILLSGDVTTTNNISEYENFIKHFKDLIGEHLINNVFIVSGNHDVNFKLHDDDHIFEKFDPINKILCKYSFRKVPVKEAIFKEINLKGASALIIALNSCIGCGLRRHLNPYKMKKIDDIQCKIIRSGQYEELDTPAFYEQQLSDAFSEIIKFKKSISVILTHHNLLPQVTLRVSPYGELMNAGLARNKFTSTKVPILYLHGHIHKDLTEIISQADNGALLISLSAPELKHGFNVIKIIFNSKKNPIGCIIEKWRCQPHLEMDKITCKIPFWQSYKYFDKLSQEARDTYKKLEYLESSMRLYELLEKLNLRSNDLKPLLQELQWFGCLKIINEDKDINEWSIWRINPYDSEFFASR